MNDLRQNLTAEESGNRLILLMLLLNSADAFFTSLAIDLGVAEANPIMASVLKLGMTWFLFYKLVIVDMLILFVGLIGRNYIIGRMGMGLMACTYSLLIIYHIVSLLFLIGSGV